MTVFNVHTKRYGVIRVARASIGEVREWIATAFPGERFNVTREEIRRCSACDSAPCCCAEVQS